MPDLIPVAHDPFNDPPTNLIPVDHDPWAAAQTHAAEVPNPAAAPLRQFGSQLMDRLIDPLQVRAGVQTAGNMAGNLLDLSTEALRPTSYSDYDPRNALAAATTDMGLNLIGGGAPAAERGALGMAGGKPITAYHGSPHDFDAFDLSKIGTGEGAQAYGHGLYFAENPETAQAYREGLSPGYQPTLNGVPFLQLPSDAHRAVGQWIRTTGASPNDIAKIAEARGSKALQEAKDLGLDDLADIVAGKHFDIAKAAREIAAGGKWEVGSAPNGRMYEVNINADPEHFLDWDAPLSQQSQHVQDAIGRTGLAPQEADLGTFAGQRITSVPRWADTPGAAQQLKDAGIPGIKYLDQGSRGFNDLRSGISGYQQSIENLRSEIAANGDPTGRLQNGISKLQNSIAEDEERLRSQTRNYVVFNDKLIDIVKKYGLAGLIAGGASHFSLTPTDHDPFAQ